jgi:hypothetical protein
MILSITFVHRGFERFLTSAGYFDTSSSPTGTDSIPSKSLPRPTLKKDSKNQFRDAVCKK